MTEQGGMSRRRFLQSAGVASVLGANALSPTFAVAHRRRRRTRPTVAVFGGGIAGLTAAHELAERGLREEGAQAVGEAGRVDEVEEMSHALPDLDLGMRRVGRQPRHVVVAGRRAVHA
jgi:NADPH-dependent 2,4-dienoyl-CoA reductase/sulfur reductase-like enzyme